MNAVATPANRAQERAPLVRLDPVMLLLIAAILLLGLIMVTSASVTVAARESGDPFAYLERQLWLVGGGLALAALALGEALELPRAAMLDELREFAGLPHRTALVADRRGVRYIDDSKGTNVGATLAAIDGLDGPLLLIAGGDGKGQDFTPLAAALRGKVRLVLLIGRDARAIGSALGCHCAVEYCATLEAAVAAAARAAQAGDTVLLSPACASLDMFRDYAHRGEAFAAAVQGLAP